MANLDLKGENGAQGSSYLYKYGTTPNTRTVVSQKLRVLTPAYGQNMRNQVGVLASISFSNSRSVEPVRGIGFGDQVAELVPSVTEPPTASLSRTMLYLSNIWQAMGYAAGVDGPVRSLAHHRWPFDIEQQLVFSTLVDYDLDVANVGLNGSGAQNGIDQIKFNDGGVGPIPQTIGGQHANNAGHSAMITFFEACWLTSYSNSFEKDTGIVMEESEAMISDVHDGQSVYGEFMATGNDPSIGQKGSERFNYIPRN